MTPSWAKSLPLLSIADRADEYGLAPLFVAAICYQESRGRIYSARFEPNYRWLFEPGKYAAKNITSLATETTLQKCSYGLFQIMGATARWMGYEGPLPGLYDTEENILWGCEYLKYLKGKYHDLPSIASAYNAGSPRRDDNGNFVNAEYVAGVMGYYGELMQGERNGDISS